MCLCPNICIHCAVLPLLATAKFIELEDWEIVNVKCTRGSAV